MITYIKQTTFILMFVLFLLAVPYFLYSYAQEASVSATGCFIINQKNLPSDYPLPSGCQSYSSSGGYTNPFPGGWEPNRLDMGYDGTFKGKIVAPFSGKIVYAATGVATWGGYIEIQADQKPAGLPTSTLYFAEGVGPLVRTGQHVNVGQPIAQAVPNSIYNGIVGNIEFGVSENGPGYVDAYSIALGGGHCPDWTKKSQAMVLSFYQWVITTLHVPGKSNDTSCAGSA
jgi:hypothetical protein